MYYLLDKNKYFFFTLILSIILFSTKWALSFYYYGGEDITLKIISESKSDGFAYFHYIKSIENLDFYAVYNLDLLKKYYISIPLGSILFHIIFFIVFGIKSFIFLEFISIFTFIYIFFLLLRLFTFSKINSLLLSTFFFILPEILISINSFGIYELNTFAHNFYNLRFPRPLISNLFFFTFLYILVKTYLNKKFFSLLDLITISILMGLTLSSFFFLFLLQSVTFFFFIVINYYGNLFFYLKKNKYQIFLSSVIFITISFPFIFFLLKTNPDYLERVGVIEVTISDKLFLIEHYLKQIFRIKILIVYLFLLLSFIFMKKFAAINLRYTNVFYILFLSSLITPIFYIIIFNKIAFLYHFNNLVVICFVLLFLLILILNVRIFLQKYFSFNKKNSLAIIILLLFFFVNSQFRNYFDQENQDQREERNNLIKIIIQQNFQQFENLKILTFDRKIMTWAILNNNKNLFLIDGTFTSRDNFIIEDDLVFAFHFLKLGKYEFKEFISNKKIGYRYNNSELKDFFWQRYTANSFHRYKNSDDFDPQILKFIKNSSPYYSHQFALPNFEINRLLDKFDEKKYGIIKLPDLLILDNTHFIFKNSKIDLNKYCVKFSGKKFLLFFKKNYCD